jgi:hypothetical protein
LLRPAKALAAAAPDRAFRLPVLPERHLAVSATVFDHGNFSADSRAVQASDIQALNDAVAESARGLKAPSGSRLSQIPEGARSSSPGLLESNSWRRLTISEHREHLLPYTGDVPCRGAVIVDPNAGMRQRIYQRTRSTRAVRPQHQRIGPAVALRDRRRSRPRAGTAVRRCGQRGAV